MSVYSLIGLASYTASLGFGIATAVVGVILTWTRIIDGITDPLLAFVYDRVNTRFGKIRILLITGYIIEALALMAMFVWGPGKGLGIIGLIPGMGDGVGGRWPMRPFQPTVRCRLRLFRELLQKL